MTGLKLWANALIISAAQMGTQLGPVLSPKKKEDPRKVCVPSKTKRAALRCARKKKAKNK